MSEVASGSGSRKLRYFLLAIAVIALMGIAVAVYYLYPQFGDIGESPEQSTQNIAIAVKEKDLSKFRKYVDVRNLSEQIVDDAFALAIEEMEKEGQKQGRKNVFEELGRSIAFMVILVMKPSMSQMVRQQIEHFVETGEVKEIEPIDAREKPSPALKENQPAVSLEKMQTAAGNFKRIVNTRVEGKQAYLDLEFVNEIEEKQILELRFRNIDGEYWQLAEIVNFRAFAEKNKIINRKEEPEGKNNKEQEEPSKAKTSIPKAGEVLPKIPKLKKLPTIPKVRLARVITENANLRLLPSNDSLVVDTLAKGSMVSVQRQSGPWFRVSSSGISGWMHGNTIRITNN